MINFKSKYFKWSLITLGAFLLAGGIGTALWLTHIVALLSLAWIIPVLAVAMLVVALSSNFAYQHYNKPLPNSSLNPNASLQKNLISDIKDGDPTSTPINTESVFNLNNTDQAGDPAEKQLNGWLKQLTEALPLVENTSSNADISQPSLNLQTVFVNPNNKDIFLNELPPELLVHIFSFLTPEATFASLLVCERWAAIITLNSLLKEEDLVDYFMQNEKVKSFIFKANIHRQLTSNALYSLSTQHADIAYMFIDILLNSTRYKPNDAQRMLYYLLTEIPDKHFNIPCQNSQASQERRLYKFDFADILRFALAIKSIRANSPFFTAFNFQDFKARIPKSSLALGAEKVIEALGHNTHLNTLVLPQEEERTFNANVMGMFLKALDKNRTLEVLHLNNYIPLTAEYQKALLERYKTNSTIIELRVGDTIICDADRVSTLTADGSIIEIDDDESASSWSSTTDSAVRDRCSIHALIVSKQKSPPIGVLPALSGQNQSPSAVNV